MAIKGFLFFAMVFGVNGDGMKHDDFFIFPIYRHELLSENEGILLKYLV